MKNHLYDLVDEFFENIDLEDEFGYIVDEKEIYDDEREEILEDLKNELQDNSYPYEIYKYYDPMVMTCHTAGQCNDEIKNMTSLIPQIHFKFIMDVWANNQLKEISLQDQRFLSLIEKTYDESKVLEKLMKIFNK